MTPRPKPGQEAPQFEATDHRGQPIHLRALRGRWVVLYFYPKDETLGCTREACGFRDATSAFAREGATIIGVSRDTPESHRSFAEHHGLGFQLVSDRKGQILDTYGVRGWLGVPRRQTFLIDPSGKVAKTYRVRRWSAHSGEVLDDIRRLKRQASDKNQTFPVASSDTI